MGWATIILGILAGLLAGSTLGNWVNWPNADVVFAIAIVGGMIVAILDDRLGEKTDDENETDKTEG